MSLLMNNSNERTIKIARKVFEKQFEIDGKLEIEYDDRRKSLMYNDILYNLSYLDTAIRFNDSKIFSEYAAWIFQLLCYVMKDLDKERIKDQMVMHYELLNESLSEVLPEDEVLKVDEFIKIAINITYEQAVEFNVSNKFELGKYVDVNKKYLKLLLNNDTKGAYQFIESLYKSGIELEDIYIKILQEVMQEVGNLWHKQEISVDKEHYCTSATQLILSQFYPLIFSKPRNGYKILTACIGSELHEMGIRMVSDLFEYRGWESVLLGAAVPNEAIIKAIKENNPDLLALSVTMPQHLPLCYELVNKIRENFKDIKIAVGGRGFQTTVQLWKKWDIDIYTEDASQLVEWAFDNIVNRG